jgi:hypothetical protein
MSRRSPAVILYDAAGVALAVADGVAIPVGTPGLLIAGKEGANSRFIKTGSDGAVQVGDNGGSLTVDQETASNLNAMVQGPGASGAVLVGFPVRVGFSDGTNTVNAKGFSDGTLQVREREDASFTLVASAIATANNKSMLSIFNADAAKKIRVHAIYLVNVRNSGVTGVAIAFELRRIGTSAPTVGTDLTANIEQLDTADAIDGDVTARTGATVVAEATKLIWRAIWSSDEWGPGPADVESADHASQTMFPMWGKHNGTTKPIVLRLNEGITLKCATNTTTGLFDIMVVISQEP